FPYTTLFRSLAGEPEAGAERRVGAVQQVADAGMTLRRHVHADLMGAPGLEVDLEQGRRAHRLERVVVGDRVFALRGDRELPARAGVPPDRRVDRSGERIRV